MENTYSHIGKKYRPKDNSYAETKLMKVDYSVYNEIFTLTSEPYIHEVDPGDFEMMINGKHSRTEIEVRMLYDAQWILDKGVEQHSECVEFDPCVYPLRLFVSVSLCPKRIKKYFTDNNNRSLNSVKPNIPIVVKDVYQIGIYINLYFENNVNANVVDVAEITANLYMNYIYQTDQIDYSENIHYKFLTKWIIQCFLIAKNRLTTNT